jgi:hypothetical protein
MINPFLNPMFSANHDKVKEIQPKEKTLKKGLFLYCRISFGIKISCKQIKVKVLGATFSLPN